MIGVILILITVETLILYHIVSKRVIDDFVEDINLQIIVSRLVHLNSALSI